MSVSLKVSPNSTLQTPHSKLSEPLRAAPQPDDLYYGKADGDVRSAGIPMAAIQNILDYEEISEETASQGEFFGLKIKDSGMEPKFSEGDVVIVRKQEDVDSGDIAVVLVNGEDATIKKIHKYGGGITLIPGNPAYDVCTFTNEQILSLPVTICPACPHSIAAFFGYT